MAGQNGGEDVRGLTSACLPVFPEAPGPRQVGSKESPEKNENKLSQPGSAPSSSDPPPMRATVNSCSLDVSGLDLKTFCASNTWLGVWPRGKGESDGEPACFTSEPGSIPALARYFFLPLGHKVVRMEPRHDETVLL